MMKISIRAALAVVALLVPTLAHAQMLASRQEISMFSAYVGTTTGGDTTTNGATYGFTLAYIPESYWGVDFDLSHSTKFNDAYESSALTTAMVDVVASPYITRWVRPYGLFGVGAIRARGCVTNCIRELSRTDFGLDAGGGVFIPVNSSVGARAEVRYFRYAAIHNDLPRLDNGPFDFWRVTFGGFVAW
jgi:opacity protein-like surface antigen